MHHTFTREEFKELLEVLFLEVREFDENFSYIAEFLSDSSCWDRKLSSINHLFSIILEQFEKKGVENQLVIDFVYNLCDTHDFEIQESNVHFLESLFTNDLGTSLSLEEELIIAENKIYASR